ncbi:LysR family transcriptional regulator [Paraglaciecola sp. L3A3]|uniref:LysR family transcriptional regulator n=1 Tax=Paraglaciecola sp. L3A3 TaxID=2686358 RepID=UPI00131BB01B|nr:LysR family transcriptional regulator [Paraglaciecola sp. L3A3]
MLERSHLMIIRSVDQLGTLTQAAEQLCLSQSALSHSIKKLELYFGTPLWEKEGRRLRLNQAGSALLNLAERLLPQFEHSEQLIKKIADGRQGNLRIGMECHPCYQWLLNLVGPFLQQYPEVDLDVRQRFQFGGMGALLGYDIDMLVTPDPLYSNALEYIPVFDYEHVLVVPKEHVLAQKEYISPADLTNKIIITYPVEPSRLDIFSQFCHPAGVAIKKHIQIETTEILLQMVAAGRGFTALPRWLVESQQNNLAISAVSLGKQGMYKTIHLGFRKNEKRPEYLQRFIQMARDC